MTVRDMDLKGGKFNWIPVGKKHEIKIGNKIGEGVRSQIYRGIFGGKQKVAVKSMLYDGNMREWEILQKLKHENIIHIYFADSQEKTMYIALDLCSCTLKEYVEEPDNHGTNLSPIEVLQQITEGLNYLHNGQKFCAVHRDLKPSNILFQYIEREEIWRVKISDFGISKEFGRGKTSTMSDLRGSDGFLAPELLDRADGSRGPGKIRKATDVFSLGIIFHYVLSEGGHPFSNDVHDVNAKIRDGKPSMDGLIARYKDEAEHLILCMIEKDYTKRITIGKVRVHHIFWDADRKIEFIQKVSDYFEDRDSSEKTELLRELEKFRAEVTGSHWKSLLYDENSNPEVKRVIEKRKGFEGRKSLQQLLRLIRNLSHHYHDSGTTAELQEELGEYPDGFADFFTLRIPKLLSKVYQFMHRLKDEDLFKKFYDVKRITRVSDISDAQEMCGVIEEGVSMMNEATPMDVASSEDEMEIDASHDDDDDDDDFPDEDVLDSTDDEQEEETKPEATDEPVLTLREYQKELAEQALQGNNSLIIAPTGSGKTAVANEIIKKHLMSGRAKSILFLVSKTTLARQQYEFFSKHLREQVGLKEIAYLIGEITVNVAVGAIIKRMKLTILTPQILIDELNRDKSFVSFNDISMMIFDECHNATKKHPYKVIMDMLMDFQYDSPPSHDRIQVVGMTASPGVGKGKTRAKVMENLITLLANLNVMVTPAVVTKNVSELKQHQNQISETFVRVEIGVDKFSKKIVKAMDVIEKQIEKKDMFGGEVWQVSKPPEDKDKQKYENWVMDLINHVKVKVFDGKKSRTVNLYASHLRMYHRLLYFKKLIPNAMEVTDSLAVFNQEGNQGDFLRNIKRKLEQISRDAEVPMLNKLFSILQEEFKRNNNESRCIIFVPRRQIAPILEKAILANEELAHLLPKSLTGSNEHAERGGMTKSDQDNSVRAFRDGKTKILIATSVAEEGLDIRACNLVIMYSYVTGEVGRIQRAGRGRAENSRSILITPCGSEQIEREKMNEICAMATEVAIEDLNELPKHEREQKISEIQLKQRKDRRRHYFQEQRLVQEASKWRIMCGQCQAELTRADQLRHIKNQHRFVVDKNFLKRVTRDPCEPHPIAPGVPFEQVATFACKKSDCVHFLGVEMQHNGKTYPTLSVRQLVFEDDMGNRAIAKQWSKCPFAVEKAVDDTEEEVNEQKVLAFVAKQANTIVKGFISDDISEDEAKEAVDMANSS